MNTYTPEMVKDNFVTMVCDKAVEIFGDNIADPTHEPIRFAFQMKVVESMLRKEAGK